MASAGTLTLSYDAPSRTFTATVTAVTGFSTMGVQLVSPTSSSFGMSSGSPGNNPSKWTSTFPAVAPPMPDPVTPGTWTATAHLQGSGTAMGTSVV
jgi:hypothetical protein